MEKYGLTGTLFFKKKMQPGNKGEKNTWKKWLICYCYNPHKKLINYHLQELVKEI